MKLAGQSNLDKTSQRTSRLMESKALVKSMKATIDGVEGLSQVNEGHH